MAPDANTGAAGRIVHQAQSARSLDVVVWSASVDTAPQVPGGPRRFGCGVPCDEASEVEGNAGRARCAGLLEVIEGSGFFDGLQARGNVDLEAARFAGDRPALVPLHGLRPAVVGQAQHDSQFGADTP